jgi:hypothetical protein
LTHIADPTHSVDPITNGDPCQDNLVPDAADLCHVVRKRRDEIKTSEK